MPSSPFNIAFWGAGEIAKTHAAAVAQVEGARLAAVYDLDPARAEALAQPYGAAAVRSEEALLAFPGVDLVYILTPPHVHAGQIIAAAEAGLPILCEKPLTMSLADADRAIACCAEKGVPLMTGQSHRFHPLARRAHDLLLAGELGDFVAAWSHRTTHLNVRPGSWLADRQIGGGITLQYALHDLDWEAWLGGPVASVSAREVHTNPQIEIEDNLWALLAFENGGSGSVGVSWSSPYTFVERGLVGSRGNLRIFDQKRLVGTGARGQKLDMDLGDDYDWDDVFVRESRAAVESLRGGEPFPVSGEDGRRTLEIGLAVQRATLTHQPVSLPLPDHPL